MADDQYHVFSERLVSEGKEEVSRRLSGRLAEEPEKRSSKPWDSVSSIKMSTFAASWPTDSSMTKNVLR